MMMPALRSLSDLAVFLTPRVLEVVDDETIVGRIIAHEDRQFDAFDLGDRPLGTFADLSAAESAVRAAGAYDQGGVG